MKWIAYRREMRFETADTPGDRRGLNARKGTDHSTLALRGLSLALLLGASIFASPALSQEADSAGWRDIGTESLSFYTGPEPQSDVVSVQPSGGSWYDALSFGYPASALAPQLAQETPEARKSSADSVLTDANEITRQSNNPLGGDFILWLNFINIDKQQGDITDDDRFAYSHLIQPVIPFKVPAIGENWIFVNRPTVPTVIDREVPAGPDSSNPGTAEFDHKGGLGDIEYLAFLGTSTPTETGWLADSFGEGDAVLAGGFTTRFPTGKDSVSENVWAAGPAATAAYIGKEWTFATLVQHWWDYEQQSNGDDFNFTRLQFFYFYSLPDGWQVGGSPKITADWSANSDDRWTVPIGIAGFKTVFIGDLPVKLGVELRPTVMRPDSLGTDWQVEFSIIPVTSNFIASWFN